MLPTNDPSVKNQHHRSPWHLKFFDSFFAAASVIITLNYLMASLPEAFLSEIHRSPVINLLYRHSFWLFGLLFGFGYSVYWHRKEGQEVFPSIQRKVYFRTILRYSLCFLIAQYGFLKLLGMQFYLGINWRDVPLEKLSGFFLTWYYFGYARPLVVIIAFFEITGSVLLLFRRTTLLGVFILLPLMMNITLIDYFYEIRGVLIYVVFMTSGLIYLLLLHWEKLTQLFLYTIDHLPGNPNRALNNSLRLGIIILAFLTQLQWVTPLREDRTDTLLQGKWKVKQQTVNGIPFGPHDWEKDTTVSVWSNLYLEGGWFTASGHPYYFDQNNAKFGQYTYHVAEKALEVKFLGEKGKEEVSKFTVVTLNGDKMQVNGILKDDTVTLSLTRVSQVKSYRPYIHW